MGKVANTIGGLIFIVGVLAFVGATYDLIIFGLRWLHYHSLGVSSMIAVAPLFILIGIFLMRNLGAVSETCVAIYLLLVTAWIVLRFGWYWNIFPRGRGFFTANRMSAFAVFTLLYLAPIAWKFWRVYITERRR